MTTSLRASLFALCLVFTAQSAAVAETYQRVVPPGQEGQLGKMVGVGSVVFPGTCRLSSATVVKSVVRLKYRCEGQTPPLELILHPPEYAGPALSRTEKFVLSHARAEGEAATLPEGFVDALTERIRQGESRWHWMKVKGDHLAAKGQLLPTPTKVEAAPSQPLDPKHVKMFEEGAALYGKQKHAEALAVFLKLARENDRFGGVLGMIVANLAPTKPDSAKVAEYVKRAEEAPDDLLSQYVAGVAAHYSAHYIASTIEEKRRLYETSIRFLDKTRPTFDFEPRVFIYLAVSHYRLGHQEIAEPLIEKAVEIAKYDPDAYYCRAEIFHRKDVARSLEDLETYLVMTRKFAAAGGWAADEKIQRVESMRDYLTRVQAGKAALAEIFDPLASDTPGSVAPLVPPPEEPSQTAQALAKPKTFGRWVVLVGLIGAIVLGVGLWLQRRREEPEETS